MIQIEIILRLMNIKVMLMYNIEKVILVYEVIIVDVAMPKYHTFANCKKA